MHQVADVVVNGDLVQHLAFAVVPLGNLGIHIQRGVGHALLRVVLGVQRTQAQLNLLVQRVLHGDHGNAVGVFTLELAGLDRSLDFLEAVHRNVRIQLAGHRDEFAIRRHVNTVRALRLRDQEQDAFLDRGFHHEHVHGR